MLTTFVRPRPNKHLIRLTAHLNRVLCLKGLPVLRDIPYLNRVIGARGICNVRHIDFPVADRDRLKKVVGPGKATFIVPNHPEFFTDWMLDKHVTSIAAPMAANWATHTVVNGLGTFVQKFWLANNLIAQIPGNTKPGRDYSVEWAMAGNGVLLHPEGAVGWHGDYVSALYPGAIEMAREAMQSDDRLEGIVAPVVWKLAFTRDVSGALHRECGYIERRLKIEGTPPRDVAKRVFRIFDALLARDEARWDMDVAATRPFRARHARLVKNLSVRIAKHTGQPQTDAATIIRGAKRWLRETKPDDSFRIVRSLTTALEQHAALDDYACANDTVTQEHLAEHLKRIRRDWCKGTLRDTLNTVVPQAAGPRTAHIRVPEPFHLTVSNDVTVEALRDRMQAALDDLNVEIDKSRPFIRYENPFLG